MKSMSPMTTEQRVIQEGIVALAEHLGAGNYLQLRERLFGEETVESLYDQIGAFEKTQD